MINVTIVDNLHRNTYPVDPNTTLRSVLEAHDVDYTTGQTKLDGSSLAAGDLVRPSRSSVSRKSATWSTLPSRITPD